MNNTIKFSVDIKNSGKRLDAFLAEKIKDYTRSYLKKLIEQKQLKLLKKKLLKQVGSMVDLVLTTHKMLPQQLQQFLKIQLEIHLELIIKQELEPEK